MSLQTLDVAVPGGAYPILIGDGALTQLAERVAACREGGQAVAAVGDADLLVAQPTLATAAGFAANELLTLPAGETTKSVAALGLALEFLAARPLNRDGALFALGGGVIGDLAGFTAASYLRGIDFYQVPTTLLAMVDSSVGGKTGINLEAGKNLAGAFWQPKAVFIDPQVLATLPAREFAAGMAEVIKYGLLADANLFDQLEQAGRLDPGSPELPGIIRRCCEIKAAVVAADEKETAASGGRALLNLGHTFAHAIEKVAGYGDYLHGEAVAIGLVLAARLSVALGRVGDDLVDRTVELVGRYDLPVALRQPLKLGELMAAMARDKKVRAGKLRFVVVDAIGDTATADAVDTTVVEGIWSTAGAA